ncbi:MAG: hypothetical protein OEV49_07210 [candidate division Zixibacteria bacterium]|nr:hypothetical protein [candidate division Zixibacteria bacterium]MDH3937102.1 hypothetical protein [candidate division Zixibacteria bacterium]MDH4033060.1 hypothetical protein [candidate division Zixibacteria bacterium]
MTKEESGNFEYTYTSEFAVPWSLDFSDDFSKGYRVNLADRLSYEVHYSHGSDRTLFRLYAGATCKDTSGHNPANHQLHAPLLWHLHYRLLLSIVFVLDHFPTESQSSPSLQSLLKLPPVKDDFTDKAAEAGIKTKPWISVTHNIPISARGTLARSRLGDIYAILKPLFEPSSEPKLICLENYAHGILTLENPYFFWYRVLETLKNPDIGVIDARDRIAIVNGSSIDIDFLTEFAHYHRHSQFNVRYQRARRQTEARWQHLLDDPKQAIREYKDSLKPLIRQFLLTT